MTRILFVCHGNICRSPMAEFVFKDLLDKKGVSDRFIVESCATSSEEIGNPVYPPVRRLLNEKGISCSTKTARQMKSSDYDKFDLIIAMDNNNLRNIKRFVTTDPLNKISLMMDFTDKKGEVADPWYTGDFKTTYDDILQACHGILSYLGY